MTTQIIYEVERDPISGWTLIVRVDDPMTCDRFTYTSFENAMAALLRRVESDAWALRIKVEA